MSNPNQACVDPESLLALAGDLSNLANKIEEMDSDLQNALAKLGATFRDEHYEQFRARFLGSRQKLGSFVEVLRDLTPKLRQDAEDVSAAQRPKLDL